MSEIPPPHQPDPHGYHQVPPPGSYPPGQPNPWGYAPPPPRSNAVVWWVVGGIAAVVLLCCGGPLVLLGIGVSAEDPDSERDEVKVSDASGEPTASPTAKDSATATGKPGEATESRKPDAPLGSQDNPVPRGKAVENKSARYEILDVRVADSLDSSFADPPAGRYVIVKVVVTNVKNETIQVSRNDFTLIVDKTEVDVDDETYTLDDGLSYDDLSPGLRRVGSIVFDVAPKSAGRGILQAEALMSMDEAVYLRLR